MIAYTTVGTNDMQKAKAFYEPLFEVVGAKQLYDMGHFVGYGHDMKSPAFAICKPFNGEAASAGNGTMIALALRTKSEVKAMHAKALELGAANEGDAGPRGEGQFYCGYFRDMDGNKINAFCRGNAPD